MSRYCKEVYFQCNSCNLCNLAENKGLARLHNGYTEHQSCNRRFQPESYTGYTGAN